MGVELTFAMDTNTSASGRVQSMLMPYRDRYEHRWVEEGHRTYFVIRVPSPGVEGFIADVRACHRTVRHISQDTVDS